MLTLRSVTWDGDEEQYPARPVPGDIDSYTRTVAGIIMSTIHCSSCGFKTGGESIDCIGCKRAFGNLRAYDVEAACQDTMTKNEHAFCAGRWALRHHCPI